MTPRLPLRVRAAVTVLVVLAVLLVAGATAVVQYGANALQVGGGFTVSSSWRSGTRWAGIEARNTTDLPITLEAIDARISVNIRILDARVIEPGRSHLLMLGAPLTPDIEAAIRTSKPLDGFVLPPHSGDRYQVAIRFEPRSEGQAVLGRTAIVYRVLGLDHGAVSDGVYCVRAPGKQGCPPFDPE